MGSRTLTWVSVSATVILVSAAAVVALRERPGDTGAGRNTADPGERHTASAAGFSPATPGIRRPRGGRKWRSHFPDVELTTHRGTKVRFYDDLLKGKIVVINFMYTTCTGT